MQKYEYDVVGAFKLRKTNTTNITNKINEMGKDDWELDMMKPSESSFRNSAYIICVFKREIVG